MKREVKPIVVKIPHLSKTIHFVYSKSDSISDLIQKIQTTINYYGNDFGIYMKNNNDNCQYSVDENIKIMELSVLENILFYLKKKEIENDNSNLKKIKVENNQKLFLTYLSQNDIINTLRMLRDGLNPNYTLDDECPLHQCIGNNNAVVLISLLVCHGANIDYRTSENISGLHKAIKYSRPEIVKVLLEFGVSPDVVDSSLMTPIHYCILHNNDTKCFEQLMKFNAKLEYKDANGLSEIHKACYCNRLEHLKLLVEHKQDINLQSENEANTPLHFAAFGNASDCIKFLLEIGAKTDIVNLKGLTVVDTVKLQFPDLIYLFKNSDELQIEATENHEKHLIKKEIKDIPNDTDILQETIICSPIFISNLDQDMDIQKSSSSDVELMINCKIPATPITGHEISQKAYFDLKTKIVEFNRSPKDCFGFSIESEIIEGFVALSRVKPSIHRICKWNVLSAPMTLYCKPFLLEVNYIKVETMPHVELVKLIRFSKDRIVLLITNNSNITSDFHINTLNDRSRIKVPDKLCTDKLSYSNDSGNIEGDISVLNDNFTKKNKIHSIPSYKINYLVPQTDFKKVETNSMSVVSTPSMQFQNEEYEITNSSSISNMLFSKDSFDSYPYLKFYTKCFPIIDDQKTKAHYYNNSNNFGLQRKLNSNNVPVKNQNVSKNCNNCLFEGQTNIIGFHHSGISIPLTSMECHKNRIHTH